MPSIRKASIEDAVLINELARQVFPHTYKGIISQSQINYMMDWMYSTESIINQMDEGHNYFISYEGGEPIGRSEEHTS